MPRLLFEKTGNAVYISHLDLMRLFQRAFQRAGLVLRHSQGFNPRPIVSIALPLSLGMESRCELLDFELEGECPPYDRMVELLNDALIDGVRARQVYDDGRRIRDLSLLDCTVCLHYDAGIPSGGAEQIGTLLRAGELFVDKKSKSGPVRQDIRPMIRAVSVTGEDGKILIRARICCQNPSLNPMLLAQAVERYLPRLRPDYVSAMREELYDAQEQIFR